MEDYQRLYLEQKVRAIQMEMQALQLRFSQIQNEFPLAEQELREYVNAQKDNGKKK